MTTSTCSALRSAFPALISHLRPAVFMHAEVILRHRWSSQACLILRMLLSYEPCLYADLEPYFGSVIMGDRSYFIRRRPLRHRYRLPCSGIGRRETLERRRLRLSTAEVSARRDTLKTPAMAHACNKPSHLDAPDGLLTVVLSLTRTLTIRCGGLGGQRKTSLPFNVPLAGYRHSTPAFVCPYNVAPNIASSCPHVDVLMP